MLIFFIIVALIVTIGNIAKILKNQKLEKSSKMIWIVSSIPALSAAAATECPTTIKIIIVAILILEVAGLISFIKDEDLVI